MANKKINQLVSKTAILSTDLFGIGDATTGQLFKKTIAELQAAIGGAVISVNGLVGTVVLDTDDIQELATPTNKYFTDARARGAISLTVTGNSGASTYSSGTGVLNVPTYTLAGLGGITASFLSGTSGISYNSTTGVISYSGTVYTDASIRALLSGSTGISYNSTTGAISYSGTVYTDASVRALISITTTGTSGASTYNNTTGVINVPNYTLAGLGGISLTSLSGGTGITYNNTTGAISYSGTVYTDASVRALISATGNISYNSTTGVISTSLTQYTDALARASVSLTTTGTSGASTYNSTTGVFNIPNYGSALSGYLPLTGGTLTGALIGTSASFSSTITGTQATFTATANTYAGGALILKAFGGTNPIYLTSVSGYFAVSNGGSADHLLIASTGAATFSSTLNVANFLSLSAATTLVAPTSGKSLEMVYRLDGANDYAFIQAYDRTNSVLKRLDLNSSVTITGAGLVGIGTTAPGTRLVVSNDGANGLEVNPRSGGTDVYAYNRGTSAYANLNLDGSYLSFASGGTERMRILGSGNVAINTTADNGYKLYVAGTIYATGNITANSDLTLKKNIELITNPTDKLMQLNGYSYQWKEDDSHQYGVIAQEVEKILPYAVSIGNDGIKGVSYNQIIPVLIEAVKEQKKELEELRDILASK